MAKARETYALNEKCNIKGEGAAVVFDRMFSEGCDEYFYQLKLINGRTTKKTFYKAEDLEKEEELPIYNIMFEKAETVVIARLYEVKNGVGKEIAKNHGHIIHDGKKGFVQAASYALKKMYETTEGGNN